MIQIWYVQGAHHTQEQAWNKRITHPFICWPVEIMKMLKSEVVFCQRIIKNYKLSDILTIDAFPFFGLDKLHAVSFILCKMFLEVLLSWFIPLSIFVAAPLAFFFSILWSYHCTNAEHSLSVKELIAIQVEDYLESKALWMQSQMHTLLLRDKETIQHKGTSYELKKIWEWTI